MTPQKTALVLGAYGLIGSACVRALAQAGFAVTGVGRNQSIARQSPLPCDWLIRDVTRSDVATWAQDLGHIDIIVNAAGALQSGAKDDLTAIHETLIAKLTQALSGRSIRFIQISAAGVSDTASTDFFRSKARGDAILMQSDLDWFVLRPTLVLAADAYGGTALLRASAAIPGLGLLIHAESPVQTVHIDDLAQAVIQCATDQISPRTCADLTEPGTQTLAELTGQTRAWLGFKPWRKTLSLPQPIARTIGKAADALGWLGWRSPLRSNAQRALQDGVTASPTDWNNAGGIPMRPLSQTLASLPATAQDRSFARLFLLLPLAIATLSLFWFASGLIAIAEWRTATAILTDRNIGQSFATIAVLGGAVLDIILGGAILIRRWTRLACLGMIATSVAYLIAGTLTAPDLWAHPLGVYVKILPGLTLALLPVLLLEDR